MLSFVLRCICLVRQRVRALRQFTEALKRFTHFLRAGGLGQRDARFGVRIRLCGQGLRALRLCSCFHCRM